MSDSNSVAPETSLTPDPRPLIPVFSTVALLGLGLMGGSLGLALKERGLAGRVIGYARTPETRRAALDRGIADAVVDRVDAAVEGADLVVLGAPLLAYEPLLRAALPSLSPGCIVTDLGSAKAQAVETCESILEGSGAVFVGGHPMTGSEESGPRAARPDLYIGAPWCLTPTHRTPDEALSKVRQLTEAVGSWVLVLSPEEHDLAVAASSHVPHLAAVALVNTLRSVSRQTPAAPRLAAGGFRDTTRVASGSPEMWRDICLSNRESLLRVLKEYREALSALERAVEDGDAGQLMEMLGQAKEFRDQTLKKRSPS
ncbi:MAG: prephenate dehydrogenase/arogenate dehydrogenase family protein [Armatimonadetes bacterium]|nr:prephenate dehydrogenase/arogenate dehydrogenase family protein [Armatimonadota bacterium]